MHIDYDVAGGTLLLLPDFSGPDFVPTGAVPGAAGSTHPKSWLLLQMLLPPRENPPEAGVVPRTVGDMGNDL